jgi:predicted  nucleic acid-binding Zn-ribbon protein
MQYVLANVFQLRERLNNDKKAIETAEATLQAELSKIGEELSVLKLNPTTPSASPTRSSNNVSTANLAARLSTLQAQLSTLTSDLNTRHKSLETDLETSLKASERKVKRLDELYRDAGRENEALYERFNEELSKVMNNVRSAGDVGVEELKMRLREQGKESEGLRRENWRLKREVAGLRAVVAGKEGSSVNGEGRNESG